VTPIEPAKVPGKPVAPNVSLIVALSTLAGLVAAAGLIFLVEYVSDTVKTPDELGELTGASFVTTVSRFRRRQHPLLEVEARPHSAVSESLRLAATSADLLFVDRSASLLVIGIDEGAGSAEITANLAASLAAQGRQVALVDATHDSAVTKLMDLDERSGSADTKVGDLTLQRVALAGGASLLLLKAVEIGALSQLGAEDAQELLDELRESCDRIIIHADPPTHFASTLVFARTADATVLVARRHQTRRGALAETADGLRRIGARVMGVVLNERRAYEGLSLRKAAPKAAPVGSDSALARAVAAAASFAEPRRPEQREAPVRAAPTPIALSWTCRCGRENPGAFPHCPRCGRSQPDEAHPRTG
jgi:Mrp family chromosome partitioning ATPase